MVIILFIAAVLYVKFVAETYRKVQVYLKLLIL